MPPSARRAAILAVRPQRAQGRVLLRAAQVPQVRPASLVWVSLVVIFPHLAQAGRTAAVCPASCKAWASRTTDSGHRGSPVVNASG
jgi:hypothetical protein